MVRGVWSHLLCLGGVYLQVVSGASLPCRRGRMCRGCTLEGSTHSPVEASTECQELRSSFTTWSQWSRRRWKGRPDWTVSLPSCQDWAAIYKQHSDVGGSGWSCGDGVFWGPVGLLRKTDEGRSSGKDRDRMLEDEFMTRDVKATGL